MNCGQRGVIKLAKGSKRPQWDLKTGFSRLRVRPSNRYAIAPLGNMEEMVNEDEHSEVEMRCRTQQGANCSGKGRGSHVGQKHLEKSEKGKYIYILYSQLLFHTESYNNFLPGATIHLCKQTQISPLSVDY